MHIALLCATNRGFRVAEFLLERCASHQVTVVSFRETPWEPRYFNAIRDLARAKGQAFHEARDVSQPQWESFWTANPVDLMLLVSWRYIVPMSVLDRVRLGAYVIHDSLLPKYRGFAPTVWAMINGEKETGATLFKAVEALDAGGIVDQRSVAIGARDTIADVVENVTLRYIDILNVNLDAMLQGEVTLRRQDHRLATYTAKWTPDDARIDWRQNVLSVHNLVRATTKPYPGAFTSLDGRKLTVWSAELLDAPLHYVSCAPGRIIERCEDYGCVALASDGPIMLRQVQFEGEAPVSADRALKSVSQTLGR